MNNAKFCRNLLIAAVLIIGIAFGTGCGGGASSTKTAGSQGLIDPSGNWKMTFTDSSGNLFMLSALFSQTGAVVSGVNFFEGGDSQANFTCIAQRDISLANGLVADVSTFTGTLTGNFGTISFTSTLNDAGTHSAGTYTLVPGANGNCLGIGLTGTFIADEIPSMTGSWTGSIACFENCPVGTTAGTISATLAQDDATGSLSGSYSVNGISGISSGTLIPDPNNFISASNIQQKVLDANGSTFFLLGGPVSSANPLTGIGLDRTLQVEMSLGSSSSPLYQVNMSH
jgi:hypothetical protein